MIERKAWPRARDVITDTTAGNYLMSVFDDGTNGYRVYIQNKHYKSHISFGYPKPIKDSECYISPDTSKVQLLYEASYRRYRKGVPYGTISDFHVGYFQRLENAKMESDNHLKKYNNIFTHELVWEVDEKDSYTLKSVINEPGITHVYTIGAHLFND